jgi:lipopolysaccharide biosynthesis glycosyltransferase
MKNLVITTFIGDCPRHSLPIHERYCEKYNLDLHVITENKIRWRDLGFEKFIAVDLLNDYDRVLYIDGDVLITPQAPNIFEVYTDPVPFYGFHESGFTGQNNRDPLVREIINCFDNQFVIWPKEWNRKLRYFNSGILLFSKHHQDQLGKFREIDSITGHLPMTDQTCLNAMITKFNMPFKNLDWYWNRGDMGVPDPNLLRYQSNFIHYCGQGYTFYSNVGKYDILKSDLEFLYPEFSQSDLPIELQQFDLLYQKGYNI